jgi:hypothetical protein
VPPQRDDIERAKHALTANHFDDPTAGNTSPMLFATGDRGRSDFGHRKESTVVLPPSPPWFERIGLTAFFTARRQAQSIFAASGTRPRLLSLSHFSLLRQDFAYAIKLMMQEKEILLFAALEWLVVGFAYLLWIQAFAWIPDSVWAEAARADDSRDAISGVMSIGLWGWSLLVVATAAYPIALLNASIVAAHYLRSSNQTSTIPACLALASTNLGRVWLFTAMDAVVTVNAILDRLPRKHGKRTVSEEASYYAWKIATAGTLPSLVAGNEFLMASKESIRLLEDQPVRTIAIRMAYSLLCWIIGVAAYAGAVLFLMMFGAPPAAENWLYHFYVLMGAPVFFAVGVTSLLRPLFVIVIAKIYTEVIPVNVEGGLTVVEPEKTVDIPLIVFVMLLCFALTLYAAS